MTKKKSIAGSALGVLAVLALIFGYCRHRKKNSDFDLDDDIDEDDDK